MEKTSQSNRQSWFYNIKKNSFGDRFDLVLCRGRYPHEYIDSFARFDENELPAIERLYSSLTEEFITEEDYTHAQNVFREFNCKTLGNYHDFYLNTDITLFVLVIQTFRKMCMSSYKLDPLHYYTALGLSCDAMRKPPKIKLDLLSDPNMHLFIERYAGWDKFGMWTICRSKQSTVWRLWFYYIMYWYK